MENPSIKNANYPIYLCVDNPLLGEYLANELSLNKFSFEKISFSELTMKISELKKSLLILQNIYRQMRMFP